MDPAFFTVRTPRARTHQQQLVCIHHVFMTTMQQSYDALQLLGIKKVQLYA
jgi:hypothetical protein